VIPLKHAWHPGMGLLSHLDLPYCKSVILSVPCMF